MPTPVATVMSLLLCGLLCSYLSVLFHIIVYCLPNILDFTLWTQFLTALTSKTDFLAIFRNEITTILTPSTSEGSEWGRWRWSRFSFWRSLITNPQCRNFELIFMRFTWLLRMYSWVNPIVFENNWPNRTTNMVENVSPKPVFQV